MTPTKLNPKPTKTKAKVNARPVVTDNEGFVVVDNKGRKVTLK